MSLHFIIQKSHLCAVYRGGLSFAQPPAHDVFGALPLNIRLTVSLPRLQHPAKGAQVRLLIFGIPCKVTAHPVSASQRAADTADPLKALVVQASVGDIPPVQVFPHIFLCPVDDGIEQMHAFHRAGFKHPPCFPIIVCQLDGFLGVGV